jgi:AcrR family transcriptional regulator
MNLPGDDGELGLRERKKQRTRQLISETAIRLFRKRGFEHVTVAEIAREAEVAEKTVFNYFPRKEDLVYGRMESFEEQLLQAVRDRGPTESPLIAFARVILESEGVLADRAATEEMNSILRMIFDSPALQARERQVLDRYTDSLADLLRQEARARPDDVRPWVVANAMMGLHRALIDSVRRGALAGDTNKRLTRRVRVQGNRALEVLQRGLDRYPAS